MMSRSLTALAIAVLLSASLSAKDAVDPRLAAARKAFIAAADPLSDDQQIAACVLEKLPEIEGRLSGPPAKLTPIPPLSGEQTMK